MKRLHRTDNGIEYVKLFAEHERKKGSAKYDSEAMAAFGSMVQNSIGSSTTSESRMRGLRVEALFASVVASIGHVVLLRAEDTGDVFFSGEEISVPDYRIVTLDGVQRLVEVKAVNASEGIDAEVSLSDAYVQRLRRYADLVRAELRFAIFWEMTGLWTLNGLHSFTPGVPHRKKWTIPFCKAFVSNEMSVLGDKHILTPAPLRIRVLYDPTESGHIQHDHQEEVEVTIASVQMISRDRVLPSPSAELAWKLVRYGNWVEQEPEHHIENGHFLWTDFTFVPREWDEPDGQTSAQCSIGSLSEMVSRAYLRDAVTTIHPTDSSGIIEPGFAGALIPDDWFSESRDLKIACVQIERKEASDVNSQDA